MTNSERKEYNIQRTIDAALQCFQEFGLEGTTQLIIAKRVGLTTKTIQRYFKSKEEIILIAMKRLNEKYYELVQRQMEKADMDACSGLELLTAFLAAHEVFFDWENRTLLLIMEMHLYLMRHNLGENQILMQINASPAETRYVMISLERGIRDGSVRSDIDLNLTYALIINSFSGMIQRMMMLPDSYNGKNSGIGKNDILAYYIERIKADLQP